MSLAKNHVFGMYKDTSLEAATRRKTLERKRAALEEQRLEEAERRVREKDREEREASALALKMKLRQLDRQKRQMEMEMRRDAATMVQQTWRTWRDWKRSCVALLTLDSILVMQRAARMWLSKRELQLRVLVLHTRCAVHAQRIVRGFFARKEAALRHSRREKAALSAQALWRGFTDRRLARAERHRVCAICLQCAFRSFQARERASAMLIYRNRRSAEALERDLMAFEDALTRTLENQKREQACMEIEDIASKRWRAELRKQQADQDGIILLPWRRKKSDFGGLVAEQRRERRKARARAEKLKAAEQERIAQQRRASMLRIEKERQMALRKALRKKEKEREALLEARVQEERAAAASAAAAAAGVAASILQPEKDAAIPTQTKDVAMESAAPTIDAARQTSVAHRAQVVPARRASLQRQQGCEPTAPTLVKSAPTAASEASLAEASKETRKRLQALIEENEREQREIRAAAKKRMASFKQRDQARLEKIRKQAARRARAEQAEARQRKALDAIKQQEKQERRLQLAAEHERQRQSRLKRVAQQKRKEKEEQKRLEEQHLREEEERKEDMRKKAETLRKRIARKHAAPQTDHDVDPATNESVASSRSSQSLLSSSRSLSSGGALFERLIEEGTNSPPASTTSADDASSYDDEDFEFDDDDDAQDEADFENELMHDRKQTAKHSLQKNDDKNNNIGDAKTRNASHKSPSTLPSTDVLEFDPTDNDDFKRNAAARVIQLAFLRYSLAALQLEDSPRGH
ncbi:Unconventional myosin-Va [Hondaea fermentalgiana]|uniref:Unconventional myosin-Va n=1 Tax=Hondaea fermentalgiana TaxID=2315210 RepID=A0A2R5GQV4_9STRA|nr:Unconventional myosin-Va [Hondaea fermentalgiana]|eukprot:GBG33266.1 Unconventional myosin-Va [Hondaea fermentalgiana]